MVTKKSDITPKAPEVTKVLNAPEAAEVTIAPKITLTPEGVAQNTETSLFPIVGLGASAGGLEAFELFFRHFVVEPITPTVITEMLDFSSVSTELVFISTIEDKA